MDKIKSLETFVRVADLNSFSRAAQSLGLSRASVTRTVAELEETMHLRLFNRTTRSVSLTSDGERVLEEAREILKRTDAVFALPGSSEPTGRLRVAATTSFAEFFLCGILEKFGEKHPGLSLELLASDRVLPLVESGIDLAFEVASEPRPGTAARRLGLCRSCLFASEDYLSSHPAPSDPEELRTHRLIGLLGENHWILARRSETRRIAVNAPLRYSAAGLIRDAVLRGNGIGCLPDIAGEGKVAAGKLVRLLPDWSLPTRNIYALFPALNFIHRGAHLLAQEVEARINARSGGTGS
ncbi:LysR family transcriptional regulator [uncultured Sutterella sp.]|uniref:LysR family transcriptional regulator n=1 Tax=uncultured Sutterella sp. TaxID=286133 RepID=UPI002601D72A|nr:LysR family transcriptional regulator [uncultured Sutterella sp.]